MSLKRFFFIAITVTFISGCFYIYYSYNPSNTALFPKCPSKVVTSYDCPGCGSQRAIHAILHGDFKTAWDLNALLFFLIPYIILVLSMEHTSMIPIKYRKYLIGKWPILILLMSIIVFTIYRNV